MGYPRDLDEYSEHELVRELLARRIARDGDRCDYCSNALGKPTAYSESCRMEARHAGDVDPIHLFLVDISRASRARARRWHPGYPDSDAWTGADWSNAMCGEAGEAANVVKKLRRHETGAALGPLDPPREGLLELLADELADVFLYLDLLAGFYDIDLQEAIVRKFNAVSIRQDFPERLGNKAAG